MYIFFHKTEVCTNLPESASTERVSVRYRRYGARILQDGYCPLLRRFIWQNGEKVIRYDSYDSVGNRCKVLVVVIVAFWSACVNGDVDDDADDDDDDDTNK